MSKVLTLKSLQRVISNIKTLIDNKINSNNEVKSFQLYGWNGTQSW